MPIDSAFWQDEEAALWAAIVAIYIDSLIQGVQGGTNALPPELQALVNVDKINEQALVQSSQFKREVLASIHDTTRERVEAVLAEWDGRDMAVLSALLEPIFSASRAEMIAITEVTRAFQDGNTLAWLATGYVSLYQWNTQKDERVCPICSPKDGRIYAVGGEKPPAHPNCRCWTSPVVRLS